MPARYSASILVLAAIIVASPLIISAQSLDSLKATRDQARRDLIKAQAAFDRADEAYIQALGASASRASGSASGASAAASSESLQAPAKAAVPAEPGPAEVTFTMNAPGGMDVSPFDYRARLVVDEQPLDWTQHASGSKETAPAGTRSLAYDVQRDSRSDPNSPAWNTVCHEALRLKHRTIVEIAVGGQVRCTVR